MATLVSERLDEPWRRRLFLPNYLIGEAAAYARIAPQTVVVWHKIETAMLTERQKRAPLSYMQLIETAVVAAFRKMKVPLRRIRAAREYALVTPEFTGEYMEQKSPSYTGFPIKDDFIG